MTEDDRPSTGATLHVMVGLPGSGKTTLAKQLERQRDAVRLTKDDWLMTLYGTADLERERVAVERLLWDLAARLLVLGVDVVLDYGLWTRAERDDYRARATALGARAEFHFLDAPLEELVRRLEARGRSADPLDVPISAEQLRGYAARFEPPGADESPRV